MDNAFVERLSLTNFRSYLKTDIDFSPGLNTIVGPNNSGKSSILDAMNLLLGDVWLGRHVPASTDFYCEQADCFEIELTLNLPTLDWSAASWYWKGLVEALETSQGRQRLRVRYQGFHGERGIVHFFKPGYDWVDVSTYYLAQAIDFVWVRAIRDITRHTATSYRSPMRELRSVLERKLSPTTMKAVKDLITDANKALISDPAAVDMQSKLRTLVKRQTDLEDIVLAVSPQTQSELLRNLELIGKDTFESPLDTKGHGTQNSVIIALFRLVAMESGKSIMFAFEEPETGLHPHGQRQLHTVLSELAGDAQVFITTHSPNLVNQESVRGLKRVYKTGFSSAYSEIGYDLDMAARLDRRLGGDFNEVFFASAALFVEGESERGFFPIASRLVAHPCDAEATCDFDQLNVSTLQSRGKNELPKFARLAKELRIPYLVLVDRDKDLKDKFLRHMVREGLLSDAFYKTAPDTMTPEWVAENQETLLGTYQVLVNPEGGFEAALLSVSGIQSKLLDAVNAVAKSYGDDECEESKLFEGLRRYKGRRLSFEVASRLEREDELPEVHALAVRQIVSLLLAGGQAADVAAPAPLDSLPGDNGP